jgi:hypothetical protein
LAHPFEPPHDTAPVDLMIHRPNQSSQDSPSFAYVRSGADETTPGRSWSRHSSHCDTQPHDRREFSWLPPTRMVGCRQLLGSNDTGGGAPARGWRTVCPSLACVLERQKCATGGFPIPYPARPVRPGHPFPFIIVHLVQPTRFVSAPLDVRSMQVLTWGGVRWELRHAPHVAATVPWVGARVPPTSAASDSSHTIADQPLPTQTPAR